MMDARRFHVHHDSITVRTPGRGTTEITGAVAAITAASGIHDGTVTVFARHTSCSLVIMENADPSARMDLHSFFDRIAPDGAPWLVHTAEGPDDSPSHLRMALTRTSETIPLSSGHLALGTWQGIYLFEHRKAPHRREIMITVMGLT
jgi:secondary thiamine-phosphate synthase enzyme